MKFGFCLKSKVDPSWWELFTSFLSLSRQCTGEAGRGRYYFKYFLNIGNRRYCFKYISNIGSRLSSISKPVLERYVQNGLIGRTPLVFQKLEALLNAEWRHILSETWDIFPRNLRYIFSRRRIDICATFTFSFVQLWSRRGQKSKMHLLSYFYWKSLKRSENLSRNIKSDILLKSMLSNPNKSKPS